MSDNNRDKVSIEIQRKVDIFALEFENLCRKQGVYACYVIMFPVEGQEGMSQIISGGEDTVHEYVKKAVDHYTKNKLWAS